MEKIYYRGFDWCLVLGIGYWKDIYTEKEQGVSGEINYLILPGIKLSWGYLIKPPQSKNKFKERLDKAINDMKNVSLS